MRELSLNVMDVVQNSITAGAALITIAACESTHNHELSITIDDNGKGMSPDMLEKVQSPFFSTRTTRKIGLGVPFFKMACEMTGGSFSITSTAGEGTRVKALFKTDHIDMAPLGDISETVLLLISCNPTLDFVYTRSVDAVCFTLDTRELREILGEDVPLSSSDVVLWIRDYLAEQQARLGAQGASTT